MKQELRAWCRNKYGNDWWKPSPEIKKERLNKAKEALLNNDEFDQFIYS